MASNGLAVGDTATIKDMPASSGTNGLSATIVKVIGKDRYVVEIAGQEKTRIVTTANLEIAGSAAASQPLAYHIVGTWDDWEPHEMAFSRADSTFGYEVQLTGDSESFKMVIDGDWDRSVYPSHGNARPGDGHTIEGPDDGGLDAEWTIMRHQEDRDGARYFVRVYVAPDGHPLDVDWKSLDRNEEPSHGQTEVQRQPVSQTQVPEAAEHEEAAEPTEAALNRPRATRPSRFGQLAASRGAEPASHPAMPVVEEAPPMEESKVETPIVASARSSGKRSAFSKAMGQAAQSQLTQKDAVLGSLSRTFDNAPGVREQLDSVLGSFGGRERARLSEERLDSRWRRDDSPSGNRRGLFQAAATGADIVEVERQARFRLEQRLKEAESLAIEDEKQRKEEEDARQQWEELKANSFEKLTRWKQRAAEQQDASGGGNATLCVECRQPAVTCVYRDWVCKECHQAWEYAREAGWDARLNCGDGYFTGEWQTWIVREEMVLPRVARLKVMERFPELFQGRARTTLASAKAKNIREAQAKQSQHVQQTELVGEE